MTEDVKKSSYKLIPFWALVSALMMGAECESCCDDCQEALDHMAGNIFEQYCDENRMDKAVDKIMEECEDNNPRLAIDNMVQQCFNDHDYTPYVACECPGCNTDYRFWISNYWGFDQDRSVEFRIAARSSVFLSGLVAPIEEGSGTLPMPIVVEGHHGDTITIDVRGEEDDFGFLDGQPVITIYGTMCVFPGHDPVMSCPMLYLKSGSSGPYLETTGLVEGGC